MKYLIFILSIFLLAACVPKRNVREIPVLTRVEIKPRLVPVKIPDDSAMMRARFECDSMNRVRLMEISQLKSSNVSSSSTYDDVSQTISYKALFQPLPANIVANDSIVYREVPIEVPYETKVNILFWWQKVLMWLGAAFVGIVLFKIGRNVGI